MAFETVLTEHALADAAGMGGLILAAVEAAGRMTRAEGAALSHLAAGRLESMFQRAE